MKFVMSTKVINVSVIDVAMPRSEFTVHAQ